MTLLNVDIVGMLVNSIFMKWYRRLDSICIFSAIPILSKTQAQMPLDRPTNMAANINKLFILPSFKRVYTAKLAVYGQTGMSDVFRRSRPNCWSNTAKFGQTFKFAVLRLIRVFQWNLPIIWISSVTSFVQEILLQSIYWAYSCIVK